MSAATALLCVAVMLCWASSPIFDKFALRYLEPGQLFIARLYLVFIVLLTPMVTRFDAGRAAVWRADKRLLWVLGGSAVTPLLGLWLFYRALNTTEASRIVPVCAGYPLIAAVMAAVFLKEPFTVAKAAGTAMVVSGVWLLAKP